MRIAKIRRRHKGLLDGSRRHPAHKIEHAARLVIGATGTPATERLLTHHGSGRLVVDVKVAGGKAQLVAEFDDGAAITTKDRAGQRIRRRTVTGRECFVNFLVLITPHSQHRTKNFLGHQSAVRIVSDNNTGRDKITRGVVIIAPDPDLMVTALVCVVYVSGNRIKCGFIDNCAHEVFEIER